MKIPLSGLWQEFKAFAFKGNMIELAVAVVIGAAFGNVIHAMVTDVINPAIGYAVTAVKEAKDVTVTAANHVAATVHATSEPSTTQPAAAVDTAAPPAAPTVVAAAPAPAPVVAAAPADDPSKAVQFDWTVGRFPVGHFVGEILNFMIIAFAVFILIVKLVGGAMKKVAGSTPSASEPTTKECPFCLSNIPLKAKKCAQCTADLPMTA